MQDQPSRLDRIESNLERMQQQFNQMQQRHDQMQQRYDQQYENERQLIAELRTRQEVESQKIENLRNAAEALLRTTELHSGTLRF